MGNDFFNEYPYTDFHELNLSWVIKQLRTFATTLEQFVSINALKYADPIQWDITKQYEKNTIVIDPLSGTAYISVAPVPVGVALTNPDYWTVVFDLEQFVTKANGNFTFNVEEQTTTTATFDTPENGWVVWGGDLYRANTNITAGDQYVVDSNITRICVEMITGHLEDLTTTAKTNLVDAINEVLQTLSTIVGDLNDLNTTDKSSVVNAINEVLQTLSTVVGDLSNLNTTDKSSVVNAINEVLQTLSTIVGDLNDLNTTDKSSVVNAINEVLQTLSTVVGDLGDLNTTDKSSVVNAINEVVQAVDDVTTSYATVSDMISDTSLKSGDVTYCAGYYTAGDKGASIYTISTIASGFYQTLSNGLYANIVVTDTMCPEQFGAKGDGVNDDVVPVNDAVKYANNVIFTGTYKLAQPIVDDLWHAYIKVPSNRILSGPGKIFITPNNYDNYSIIDLAPEDGVYKTNVIVDGLTLEGDKSTHTGTTGQWGFGVAIWGASKITVRNCKISKFWGDAIYLGRRENDLVIPSDVIIENNILDDCRRNNISVVSGERVNIHHNVITNASGQNPQAGIDLEPDNYRDLIDNIIIDSNIFLNNHNYGVLIVGVYEDANYAYNTKNITVSNNEFSGVDCTALYIVNNVSPTTSVMGPFDISNNKIHNCFTGIYLHKAVANIIGNTFTNFTLFTNEHLIYCDNGNQFDINVKANVFKACRSSVSLISLINTCAYITGNTFLNPNAPITIEFNYMSDISENVFSSYYSSVSVNVIKYSGSDGGMTVTNNTVLRRGSGAQLVFLNSDVATPTIYSPFINNNYHLGVSFTNITNGVGANNYINGVSV